MQLVGFDPGSNSMAWSHGFRSRRVSNDSLAKTSSNSHRYSGISASAFAYLHMASASLCEVMALAQMHFHLWRKVYIQQVVSFGQCIIWTKVDYIGIEGGDGL